MAQSMAKFAIHIDAGGANMSMQLIPKVFYVEMDDALALFVDGPGFRLW
jgi:hypothetical protein